MAAPPLRSCGLASVLLAVLASTAGCSPGLRLEVRNDSAETVSIDVREGESHRMVADAKSILHGEVPANRGEYFELDTGSRGWSVFVDAQRVIGSDTWAYEVPVVEIHIRADGTVGTNQ